MSNFAGLLCHIVWVMFLLFRLVSPAWVSIIFTFQVRLNNFWRSNLCWKLLFDFSNQPFACCLSWVWWLCLLHPPAMPTNVVLRIANPFQAVYLIRSTKQKHGIIPSQRTHRLGIIALTRWLSSLWRKGKAIAEKQYSQMFPWVRDPKKA